MSILRPKVAWAILISVSINVYAADRHVYPIPNPCHVILADVQARSAQWRQGLDAIARRLGSPPVQGRGLLLALQLPGDDAATQVAAKLMARADGSHAGMLVNAVRPQRLRFVPALNMQADEVSLALVWLEAALF